MIRASTAKGNDHVDDPLPPPRPRPRLAELPRHGPARWASARPRSRRSSACRSRWCASPAWLLLPLAAFIGWLASRPSAAAPLVWVVILGNLGWTAESFVMLGQQSGDRARHRLRRGAGAGGARPRGLEYVGLRKAARGRRDREAVGQSLRSAAPAWAVAASGPRDLLVGRAAAGARRPRTSPS